MDKLLAVLKFVNEESVLSRMGWCGDGFSVQSSRSAVIKCIYTCEIICFVFEDKSFWVRMCKSLIKEVVAITCNVFYLSWRSCDSVCC